MAALRQWLGRRKEVNEMGRSETGGLFVSKLLFLVTIVFIGDLSLRNGNGKQEGKR